MRGRSRLTGDRLRSRRVDIAHTDQSEPVGENRQDGEVRPRSAAETNDRCIQDRHLDPYFQKPELTWMDRTNVVNTYQD